MRPLLERFRLVIAIASSILILTTFATLGWAVALTVQLIGDLLNGGWRDSALVVDLIEVIDLLLIATVQVIFAIGLWELFVGTLSVPEWLRVDSLAELKNALAQLVVLVIAVKFVEKLIKSPEAIDVFYYAAAVSLVGFMLVALTLGKKSSSYPPSSPAPIKDFRAPE